MSPEHSGKAEDFCGDVEPCDVPSTDIEARVAEVLPCPFPEKHGFSLPECFYCGKRPAVLALLREERERAYRDGFAEARMDQFDRVNEEIATERDRLREHVLRGTELVFGLDQSLGYGYTPADLYEWAFDARRILEGK